MRSRVPILLGCWAALLTVTGCSPSPSPVADARRVALATGGEKTVRAQKPDDRPEFRLPDDDAGRLLAKALAPQERCGPLDSPTRPAPAPGPRPRAAEPAMPLPAAPAHLPRLPLPPQQGVPHPEFAPEETLGEALPPELPQRPSFAVGRPVREERADPAIPPPLPPMARPLTDRVPVEDATQAASRAAVLAAPLPYRTTPVPYTPTRVPDPFEHRRPLTLPVPEETVSK
jgi:hypothetical protein